MKTVSLQNNKLHSNEPRLVIQRKGDKKSYCNGKSVCLITSKSDKKDKAIVCRCVNEDDHDDNLQHGKAIIDNHQQTENYVHIFNDKAKRETIYVCGPNQAGKSTYVSNYLREYQKVHKDTPIYLFSRLEEDDVLDDIETIRVNCYELEPEYDIRQYEDSFCVFDDIDQFKNPIGNILVDMINEILCNGAHYNISIIITNHLLSDYKRTRTILNEVSSITMFPYSGCRYQMKNILKYYIGLEPEQIKKVLNLNSRWVTIFKDYPTTILYQSGVYLP